MDLVSYSILPWLSSVFWQRQQHIFIVSTSQFYPFYFSFFPPQILAEYYGSQKPEKKSIALGRRRRDNTEHTFVIMHGLLALGLNISTFMDEQNLLLGLRGPYEQQHEQSHSKS